jgi:hypothetical protein
MERQHTSREKGEFAISYIFLHSPSPSRLYKLNLIVWVGREDTVFHWLHNCSKDHVKTILYLVGVSSLYLQFL